MTLLLWSSASLAGVFVDGPQARALVEQGAAVIDARGEDAWEDGHVPGSWPFWWSDHVAGFFRSGTLTTDMADLKAAFDKAGVRDDRPVLVYGAGKAGWGEEGRVFWTLEYLGHPQVFILDGGFSQWPGPVSKDRTPPVRGQFTPRPDETRRATADEVASGAAHVWDTRTPAEYAGATPYGEARGGHVPGAAGLWYAELLRADGTLQDPAALRQRLAAFGLTPDRPVYAYCTGGVRSGFAYAVLRELGYPQASNYDGSMWEWAGDKSRPMVR